MKTKIVFAAGLLIFLHFVGNSHSLAQVILGASPYTENFNSIGGGLPTGWTVRTAASTVSLGTPSTLVTNATTWNSTTGNYRNVSSATGLTISSSATLQNGSTDRALSVRQTGSFGDPGAAFVLQLNNTIGLYDFSLSFKLESLDGSAAGRTVTWKVDYGIGNVPTSFTQIATSPGTLTTTLSSSSWGSTGVTANFGSALDNNSNSIWIRIVTLSTSTGASSRPTSAIDDFQLSYSNGDIAPPTFIAGFPKTSNINSSGMDLMTQLDESGKTFFIIIPDDAPVPTALQIKNGQGANGTSLPGNLYGTIRVNAGSTIYSVPIAGLHSSTKYDVYIVAEDDFSNLQTSPSKLDVETDVDSSSPGFATFYPKINSILPNGFLILTSLDESGRTFFVVTEDGSPPPTSPEVKNGQDGNGIALSANLMGTINVYAAQLEYTVVVDGLNPETKYDVYFTAEDDEHNLQATPSKLSVTTESNRTHQTISFGALGTKTFGDAPFDFSATSSSGLTIRYVSSDTTVLSINNKTASILKSGTVIVTALQSGDENYYAAAEANQNLEIVKASQLITFNPLQTLPFGSPPFSLIASGGGSTQPVVFMSSNSGVATIDGNLLRILGVGTSIVKASQAGNENFNPAPDVPQTFVVTKAAQVINFNSLPNKIFGDAPFDLLATGGDSAMPVTFASSKTSVATIVGNMITIVGSGTSKITASQIGNPNFNAATDIAQTLTVSKADQSIVFGVLAPVIFGEIPLTLTATGGRSGLPVTFTSSKPSVATVNGNMLTIIGAGTTTITAKQSGNTNYNAAVDVPQLLTVNKASQAITFNALPQKTFGDSPMNLTATGGGSGQPVTFTVSNTGIATVNGSTLTLAGAGTVTVTAKQAGNTNYNVAVDVSQTLTIAKANQSITFNALPLKTFGDPSFNLSAKGGLSNLPIAFSSSNTNVATVSNSVLTIAGAGTATITASQLGNGNYNPATSVTQILTVSKASQTILFLPIHDKTFGDAAFNVLATSSSGLTINYNTTSDKIVINGNQITLAKPGRATLTASQPGNSLFNPAPPVDQIFCVKPSKPVVGISGIPDHPALASDSPSGNQWYLNGVAIDSASDQILSIAEAGIYQVQVSEDGCVSDFSDSFPMVVTGELPLPANEIKVYPNPVSEYLEARGLKEPGRLQILDIAGTIYPIVLEKKGDLYRVDVQHLSRGLYFLRIAEGNSVHHVKFVKE